MARPSADHHYDFRNMKRGQEAKREAERKAKSKTPPKCGIIRGMKTTWPSAANRLREDGGIEYLSSEPGETYDAEKDCGLESQCQ